MNSHSTCLSSSDLHPEDSSSPVTTAISIATKIDSSAPQLRFSDIHTTISIPDSIIEGNSVVLTICWLAARMAHVGMRLLQHMICIPLLTLHLCALPLLFTASKATQNVDLWACPLIVLSYPPRGQGNSSRRQGEPEPGTCEQTRRGLADLLRFFCAPFHAVLALYQLLQFIDQHPDVLSCYHTACTLTSKGQGFDRDQSCPSSANGDTATWTAPKVNSHTNYITGPNNEIGHDQYCHELVVGLGSEHEAHGWMGNDQTHPRTLQRNSSIQLTPESMRPSPTEVASVYHDLSLHDDDLVLLTAAHHTPELNESEDKANDHMGLVAEIVTEKAVDSKDEELGECSPGCGHLDSSDVKGCPMFEHRHAQSKLPKRVESNMMKNQASSNGSLVTPFVNKKDGANKRNRLQRRVKRA